ncbi:MAG: YggS family pyridoxal phosphate-dependent enzyme [bacterium]|jgi:pyridoxal phosphate enzyme (YggS family)
MEEPLHNIIQVQEQIAQAARRSGRDPADITLIGVTKSVPVDKIEKAILAGIKHIGENRVQEAKSKYEAVGRKVKWHLIGHLQRNKVKQAIVIFDFIHSLDRLSLAREIQKQAAKQDINISCLVQVNVAGEESKFGLAPEELLPFVRQVAGFPNLTIRGLMTIAPYTKDPEEVRPVFRRLRELFTQPGYPPEAKMEYLSMGMSNDYTVAIEEGANMVRLGTKIFGSRNTIEE